MADQGDKDTVVLRNPRGRTKSKERSVSDQVNEIPMRKLKKSHVSIAMDNVAFAKSQEDLDMGDESCHSHKLFRAVAQNRYKECKNLLDKGMRVNSVDATDGSTLLHYVAKKARKESDQGFYIGSLFITRGAALDATDNKRNTPLHIAAREGLYKLCEIMIDQAEATENSILNCQNEKGMTSLHLAAQEGQCAVVQLLMRRGAKSNVKDDRAWFPVHYAVDKGCVECCKVLAPYYQGDAALTKKQEALLMIAARQGHYNLCKEFSPDKLGVDYKDTDHNTALHIAAKKGFDKFVAFLLELGASPDLPNYCGYTPLMAAVAKDKEKCVAVLAGKGASLTLKSSDKSNVLHIAVSNRSCKCMAYLLKHNDAKKLINEADNDGFTPLLRAVEKKSSKCLKLLEDAGASPLFGNENKASVIYFSTNYKGSIVIPEMLVQEKNVNLTNEERLTPLHIAAREGSTEACKSLLSKGARINVSDNEGRTPLHWASAYGHDHTLRFLLKHGASKRARDDKNFTALHSAAFSGKLECCKALLEIDRGIMKETDKKGKYALETAFEQGRFEVFTFLMKHFSQRMLQIPEDLAERFHSYVHKMVREKKKALLDAVIKTSWWEAGFGAAKQKFHGEEPCSLFRDIIKTFPDLAYGIMSRCHSRQNFRLLEDNFNMENPKETLDTGSRRSRKASVQRVGEEATSTNLNWKLQHPVSTMVSKKCLELLQHPLVKAWVGYKWRSYAGWIFTIIMGFRAFSIAMLVWLLCSIRKSHQLMDENKSIISPYNLWLMFIAFLLQLLVDVNNWWRLRLKNISLLMVFEMVGLLLTFVALVCAFTCASHTSDDKVIPVLYMVGIVALVLEGLHFIFVVDQLPFANVLTSITRNFLFKYFKGIFCVTSIVILFAFIFHLLFWRDDHFTTMAESMLSIALWQWGDFNQNVFFDVENFRMFSHILFIMYLFTFGALIVTIIQAPPIERETIHLNKEINIINLLFEIDVSFPMFRKVCEGNPLLVKKNLGLRKSCDEQETEASVDDTVFMLGNKCQLCRIASVNESYKERRSMHDLLMGSVGGLRHDLKNMQNQINLLQMKASMSQ